MNYHGKIQYAELRHCTACGMSAGMRKMRQTNPETFFVVCECCGVQTKEVLSQNAATRLWNGGKVYAPGR